MRHGIRTRGKRRHCDSSFDPASLSSVLLSVEPADRRAGLAVLVPLAVSLWCGPLAPALAAGPLPSGGHYVAGSGSISGGGNALTINQTSSSGRGVIDWNSFSIGRGNTVTINNGTGATLNRVTGGNPSLILGALSATGSVYVINPQGILVGPSGVVSTGGRFVASTLDVGNDAFMQGGPLTLTGTSNASVINLGKLSSSNGDVFLIARTLVSNDGTIEAPNGSAELATSQQVLLQDSSTSKQVFVQAGSNGTVMNTGAIGAAQVNLQAADGNVFALAGNHAAIRATGTATRDGHVWLVADSGGVTQLGTVNAVNADGTGGTVDTAAQTVSFGMGLFSSPSVVAGQWNVSAPGFTIGSVEAGTFTRSLNAGTSVDVQATNAAGNAGDLNVAANLGWSGPASLTLAAYRNLSIAPNTTIRNTGNGNLTLRADAAALDNSGGVVNQGTVDWSASTGIVSALYDSNGSYSPGTLLSNQSWTAAPYSGLVTQITAYKLVNSVGDLQNISLDLASNYALGTNINAAGFNFVAIGNNPTLGTFATPFTGQFDGMGHTIDQLMVGQTLASQPFGLFGILGAAGVVRNVGVTNSFAGGHIDLGTYGILVGQNEGLIANAYTTGSVNGQIYDNTSGGLVGTNDGVIQRSWSSASDPGEGNAGGLVGFNTGTISQSYATGNVSSTHGVAGGLVAENSGTISQSYATGTVFSSFAAGGLVGNNEGGTISQSYASGLVSGFPLTQVGGIAGFNTGTIATDSYWNTETTAQASGASTLNGSVDPLPAANGLTAAQMSNPASFASWDFSQTGTWAMPAGATQPVLRWQVAH
jgi:filamentous hemagglutinin family protein